MNKRAVFCGLGVLVLLSRLCHVNILWIEEGYPSAAAIQMLHGAIPYRDFWFDKPPLFPATYLLWGGLTGLPLRLAGALFVMACAWMIYKFARDWWGEREGLIAATLLVFAFAMICCSLRVSFRQRSRDRRVKSHCVRPSSPATWRCPARRDTATSPGTSRGPVVSD